jgi:hypothetical protein
MLLKGMKDSLFYDESEEMVVSEHVICKTY